MSAPGRAVRLRRALFGPAHDAVSAVWAVRELRRVRRRLRVDGTRSRIGEPPRRVSRRSGRIVGLVLRAGRASCLERSLIRQAWLARLGAPRDVVIGVNADGSFPAHAWVDGDDDGSDYLEIHRIPPGGAITAGSVPPAARFA